MSFDGNAEAEAVMALLSSLCGGRVFEEAVEDDDSLEFFDSAKTRVKPYLVVHFLEPYDSPDDRSITDERQQPMIQPGQVECFAADKVSARLTGAAVRETLRGVVPTPNASPIRLGGGGLFAPTSNVGANSRYRRLVTWEHLLNMQVQDLSGAP